VNWVECWYHFFDIGGVYKSVKFCPPKLNTYYYN